MKINLMFLLLLAGSSLALDIQLPKNTKRTDSNETVHNVELVFNSTEVTTEKCEVIRGKHVDGTPISGNKCKPPLATSTPAPEQVTQSPPPRKATASESEDMNKSDIYKGGQEVDEIGPGDHKPFISKEEGKALAEEALHKTVTLAESDHSLFGLESRARVQTTVAAVAATICLALAMIGYAGVLLWRKMLQRKYGNREELINEDDLGDLNDADLQHFQGATIQIID